jgi:hypothetical protein
MNHDNDEMESSKESVVPIENVQYEDNATHNPIQSTSKPSNVLAPELNYVTGVKLWTLLAALTLVLFLMMLDMSIVVTVSSYSCYW